MDEVQIIRLGAKFLLQGRSDISKSCSETHGLLLLACSSEDENTKRAVRACLGFFFCLNHKVWGSTLFSDLNTDELLGADFARPHDPALLPLLVNPVLTSLPWGPDRGQHLFQATARVWLSCSCGIPSTGGAAQFSVASAQTLSSHCQGHEPIVLL